MFVPASRAAVHKRMKEGRLTAFCFHVVHEEKTFFGNVRKAKATPFVYIPVSLQPFTLAATEEFKPGTTGYTRGEGEPKLIDSPAIGPPRPRTATCATRRGASRVVARRASAPSPSAR